MAGRRPSSSPGSRSDSAGQGRKRSPPPPSAARARPRVESKADPRTFYQILGVWPGASAADIRKAYLERMKRFHPDTAASAAASQDAAAALNEAYWWIGDPNRRIDYDLKLGRTRLMLTQPSRRLTAPPPRLWAVVAGLLSVLTCAVLLLHYASLPSATTVAPAVTQSSTPTARYAPSPYREALRAQQPAIIHEAGANFDWLALQSNPAAIQQYSLDCWASLAQSGSSSLYDYCLSFDAAARRPLAPSVRYFRLDALRARAASFRGKITIDESFARQLARIEALLARNERYSAAMAKYDVDWFRPVRTVPIAPPVILRDDAPSAAPPAG